MIRNPLGKCTPGPSIPRESGDDPTDAPQLQATLEYSPRERG